MGMGSSPKLAPPQIGRSNRVSEDLYYLNWEIEMLAYMKVNNVKTGKPISVVINGGGMSVLDGDNQNFRYGSDFGVSHPSGNKERAEEVTGELLKLSFLVEKELCRILDLVPSFGDFYAYYTEWFAHMHYKNEQTDNWDWSMYHLVSDNHEYIESVAGSWKMIPNSNWPKTGVINVFSFSLTEKQFFRIGWYDLDHGHYYQDGVQMW
jgi:hypothetical protein